jgi:hypothetical protein
MRRINAFVLVGAILVAVGAAMSGADADAEEPEEWPEEFVVVAGSTGHEGPPDTVTVTLDDDFRRRAATGRYLEEDVDWDSLEAICEERGHVPDWHSMTCLRHQPRVVDLEDRTLVIRYNRSVQKGVCRRCGAQLSEPVVDEADTTVVWAAE